MISAVILACLFLFGGQQTQPAAPPVTPPAQQAAPPARPVESATRANEAAKPAAAPVGDETPVVPKKTNSVNGQTLAYPATTGFIPIKNSPGQPGEHLTF